MEFHFDETSAARVVSPEPVESVGAQVYLARVAAEDGAALVGHVAHLRRGVSRAVGLCLDDLTKGLNRVSPAHAAHVREELAELLAGAQRLGGAAHRLDVAAQHAHTALFDALYNYSPELEAGETARDEDARDVESAPASPVALLAPEAEAETEAEAPEAEAPRVKIPVSDECHQLRRQFWAVVHKASLSSMDSKRDDRLNAIGAHIGREVDSINRMSAQEWSSTIYAIEDGSLMW